MLLGCPWEDTVGFRVLVMELWVCLLPAFEDFTKRHSHPSLLQGQVAPLSAWTDIRDSDQWGCSHNRVPGNQKPSPGWDLCFSRGRYTQRNQGLALLLMKSGLW